MKSIYAELREELKKTRYCGNSVVIEGEEQLVISRLCQIIEGRIAANSDLTNAVEDRTAEGRNFDDKEKVFRFLQNHMPEYERSDRSSSAVYFLNINDVWKLADAILDRYPPSA